MQVCNFFSVPRNPLIQALLEQMKEAFDGGWDTHSIKMVDQYFTSHPPSAGTLVLPYGALFPFSWKPRDLGLLFNGTGWDWSTMYGVHIYYSQSHSFFRSADAQALRAAMQKPEAERKNWLNAVELALGGGGGLEELCALMDLHLANDQRIAFPTMLANAERWNVPICPDYGPWDGSGPPEVVSYHQCE